MSTIAISSRDRPGLVWTDVTAVTRRPLQSARDCVPPAAARRPRRHRRVADPGRNEIDAADRHDGHCCHAAVDATGIRERAWLGHAATFACGVHFGPDAATSAGSDRDRRALQGGFACCMSGWREYAILCGSETLWCCRDVRRRMRIDSDAVPTRPDPRRVPVWLVPDRLRVLNAA
jgi:hypothetical protein